MPETSLPVWLLPRYLQIEKTCAQTHHSHIHSRGSCFDAKLTFILIVKWVLENLVQSLEQRSVYDKKTKILVLTFWSIRNKMLHYSVFVVVKYFQWFARSLWRKICLLDFFFLFSSNDSSFKQTWKISGCVMAEVAVLILTLSTEILICFSEWETLDMEVGF